MDIRYILIGEGAPDYAALYENRSIKSLPFPELFPQLTPFHVNPNTGYDIYTFTMKNSHSFVTADILAELIAKNIPFSLTTSAMQLEKHSNY